MPSQKKAEERFEELEEAEVELPSFGGFPRMRGFGRLTPIEIDHESTPASGEPDNPHVLKSAFKVYTSVVGADGSGDYETIDEALKNLPAEGGSIFIKAGTYIVEELNITKDNVTLTGDGTGTILQKNVNDSQDLISINAQSNIKIENLKLVNTATTDNPSGINIKSLSDEIRIFNCDITAKGEAITIGPDSGGTKVDKVFINNCLIESDGGFRAAIGLHGCENVTISNCFITAPNTNGVGITNSYETSATERIIISNCNIEDCALQGIDLVSDTNFFVISSCIIQNNNDGIIFETDGDHAKTIVNGNQIIGNSRWGINIGNTSDRIITTSNILLSNSTANLIDNGTNGVTANNITT